MWLVNGFMTSAVFMLWYASMFDMGESELLPVVYVSELVVTMCVSNVVRKYEHPRNYEDLAKFRNDVIPIRIVSKSSDVEINSTGCGQQMESV